MKIFFIDQFRFCISYTWGNSKYFSVILEYSLHKKWSCPFKISSVNVTKFGVPRGIGNITEEILNKKFNILCSDFSNFNNMYLQAEWRMEQIIFWYITAVCIIVSCFDSKKENIQYKQYKCCNEKIHMFKFENQDMKRSFMVSIYCVCVVNKFFRLILRY